MRRTRRFAGVFIAIAAMIGAMPAAASSAVSDELFVVLYNDHDVDGDLTLAYDPVTDEAPAHQLGANGQTTNFVRTLKAQLVAFSHRSETHGRRVRLIAVSSAGGIVSTCAQRQIDATLVSRLSPWMVVGLGDNMTCFADEMVRTEIPFVGALRDIRRKSYLAGNGFIWSMHADLEEDADASASFICDKLTGAPASFAGGSLALLDRRFALFYPNAASDQRGPATAQAAHRLLHALEARCDLKASTDGSTGLMVKEFRGDGRSHAHDLLLDASQASVTTIICYCVPVLTEMTVTTMMAAATSLGYFPEWYFDVTSRMYRSIWQRRYVVRGHAVLGMTPERLTPGIRQQEPYLSYRQVDRGDPNFRFNQDIYDAYTLLFWAIEDAGPDASLDAMQAGLAARSERGDDPAAPLGGFEAGSANPYTYFDRYRTWWFDPLGWEPAMLAPTGCARLTGEIGSAGDGWTEGDAGLFARGTCSGSPIRAGAESVIL